MTRGQIERLLRQDPKAVHKGIIRIFLNQEPDERASGRTCHSNGTGFNYRDAEYGTYLAKWAKNGRKLTGRYFADARKMCLFYVRQLVEESEMRLEENMVRLTRGSLNEMDPFGGAIWWTADRAC